MATEAKTYPKISKKIWWLFRGRLAKSMPTVVTPTLVSSMAEMTEGSARSNVIAPLRELGLLDKDNKPTALAERLRHDDDYKEVCLAIRKQVYPTDLIEAFSDAQPEQKDAIAKWFMKVGKVGDAAAKMYADTYILLSQADVNKQNDSSSAAVKNPTRSASTKPKVTAETTQIQRERLTPDVAAKPQQSDDQHSGNFKRRLPAIHIDVQVHISPETSSEQIDKIFASMAKHLGGFIN
jgi:Family of unknown function (DUF5343)